MVALLKTLLDPNPIITQRERRPLYSASKLSLMVSFAL